MGFEPITPMPLAFFVAVKAFFKTYFNSALPVKLPHMIY